MVIMKYVFMKKKKLIMVRRSKQIAEESFDISVRSL